MTVLIVDGLLEVNAEVGYRVVVPLLISLNLLIVTSVDPTKLFDYSLGVSFT